MAGSSVLRQRRQCQAASLFVLGCVRARNVAGAQGRPSRSSQHKPRPTPGHGSRPRTRSDPQSESGPGPLSGRGTSRHLARMRLERGPSRPTLARCTLATSVLCLKWPRFGSKKRYTYEVRVVSRVPFLENPNYSRHSRRTTTKFWPQFKRDLVPISSTTSGLQPTGSPCDAGAHSRCFPRPSEWPDC